MHVSLEYCAAQFVLEFRASKVQICEGLKFRLISRTEYSGNQEFHTMGIRALKPNCVQSPNILADCESQYWLI